MGKRKAEIFTVIESVTSWLEASSHSPADSESSTEGPNQVSLGQRLEEQLQLVGLASNEANTGRSNPVLLQPVEEHVDPPTTTQSRRTFGDVAVGPSENEAKATGPPHTNELEDPEGEVRHDFWELLKTVGYEVWKT